MPAHAPAELQRLRTAIELVIDRFVDREATSEQLDAWASILESFAEHAAASPPEALFWGISGHRGIMGVMGMQGSAGFAPSPSLAGDTMTARLTFSSRHEGHRGLAHGGLIAQAFDDFCGLFDTFVPGIRYTGQLTVHFLKPVPLNKDVLFEGAVVAKEGSRTMIEATATIDGVVYAEANAVMVAKSSAAW
ncbi:MAG: PaaI family thioesterase [Dehalococcoidia bacterium]